MTEFRVWNDAPPLFLLSKTLAADCIAEHKHYSINGVEVSKEQFEIAHAATFKSKPLASSCSVKFWPVGNGPMETCLRPNGRLCDHSTMATEPKPLIVGFAESTIDWARM